MTITTNNNNNDNNNNNHNNKNNIEITTSFHDMFNSLAEPNRTKSYKLERVLFKTLEYFPSALFPKLWNSLEWELEETKSAKLFKRKIFKNYLDSYASYMCK